MISKIVVDSSVVISSFGRLDDFTSDSNKFFKRIETGYQLVVPVLVLVEVAVKLFSQKIPNTLDVVAGFMEAELVLLDNEFVGKLLKFLDSSGDLRSSDFVIAVTARQSGAVLVTWDKRLLGNKICRAMTPRDFLAQSAGRGS